MKIAIYTCNIGNYRNEFKNYYDVIFDSKIDYFLYTDKKIDENELEHLKNWKIQYVKVEKSEGCMDDNRWASKVIKFKLPELLQSYDLIMWIDSKMFWLTGIQNITYENIIKIFTINDCDVINYAHPYRTNVFDELLYTQRKHEENFHSASVFCKYLRKYVSKFVLPDTAVIIRKNKPNVNEAFEYCLEIMKIHNLKRDQNVYNYAFDMKGVLPVVLPALSGSYDII